MNRDCETSVIEEKPFSPFARPAVVSVVEEFQGTEFLRRNKNPSFFFIDWTMQSVVGVIEVEFS